MSSQWALPLRTALAVVLLVPLTSTSARLRCVQDPAPVARDRARGGQAHDSASLLSPMLATARATKTRPAKEGEQKPSLLEITATATANAGSSHTRVYTPTILRVWCRVRVSVEQPAPWRLVLARSCRQPASPNCGDWLLSMRRAAAPYAPPQTLDGRGVVYRLGRRGEVRAHEGACQHHGQVLRGRGEGIS